MEPPETVVADPLSSLAAALAGRYTIERELGRGGMATVYLARDAKHQRRVAIKVLKPELAAALGPERFLREIEIAAGLTHPHILPLHDSGDAAGLLYYVMPYVEGESLRDRLACEGQLPLRDARSIMQEVGDALGYAHAHGVVHRDVKPENVLLSGGHAVVTDFGVAKALSAAGADTTLTNAGVALGTPAYMAPEQAAADPAADHRVDVYALGVMAYEMLGGRTPFAGRSAVQTLAAHITEAPRPVIEVRPDCPLPLAAVVMRCLEKAPDARPQKASEIVQALDPRLTPAGRRGMRARHRRVLIVASVALLLLVGLGRTVFLPTAARATLLTLMRRPDAALVPARLLVVPLENQTGDTTLDALGVMAADWIGQALSSVSGVEVVDPRTALATHEVVRRIPWPLRSRDQAVAMARETGAGTLVVGAFYKDGDSLLFEVKITDVVRGRLVRALAPVRGSLHAPSRALAELQRRVAATVALASDTTAGTQIGSFAEPPSLDAYEEVYRGVEAYFRGDTTGEYAHLERAARLDTSYTTPLVFLAFARTYNGQYWLADSVVHRAERLNERLAPAERAMLDHVEALIRGDPGEAVRAAGRFAALMPGSQESPLLLASVALSTFKPRLALNALARVDPDRGMNLAGPFYWLYQAEAAAQLGDWPKSLAMGDAGRRRFPASPSMSFAVARAQARLGRVTDLEQTVANRPARNGGDVLVGQARLAIAMWAELRMAGHRDAADRLIARYAVLLDAVRGDTTRDAQYVRGGVLWRAGRIAEARDIFAVLETRDTSGDRFDDVAQLGITEAMLGDRAAAVRAERVLGTANPRYDRGVPKLLEAEVVAALGDRDRAVQLLQQAISLGAGLETLSSVFGNPDLEPLYGYPPFEELLKPTG
jgi:tRNA A-37 threonylcarbamoyl transferase component Bud32